MSITPKVEFIQKALALMCKHCRKCNRRKMVEKRLNEEIKDGEFDYERHPVVDKILREEP